MPVEWPARGVVYTETIVHAAPSQFANDAPYQLAIIDLDRGERITVRIEGRVKIGDRVALVEERDGVPYYTKAEAS